MLKSSHETMGRPMNEPIEMFCDKERTIHVANNLVVYERTLNFHHFFKDGCE